MLHVWNMCLHLASSYASWWFQPNWKILVKSQNGNLPQVGAKLKHIWNQHPVGVITPLTTGSGPPSLPFLGKSFQLRISKVRHAPQCDASPRQGSNGLKPPRCWCLKSTGFGEPFNGEIPVIDDDKGKNGEHNPFLGKLYGENQFNFTIPKYPDPSKIVILRTLFFHPCKKNGFVNTLPLVIKHGETETHKI